MTKNVPKPSSEKRLETEHPEQDLQQQIENQNSAIGKIGRFLKRVRTAVLTVAYWPTPTPALLKSSRKLR